MSKPVRIHLAKDGKNCYCGIAINKSLSIARKGEVFFEVNKTPIQFNQLCKNCISLFVKNPIYRNYVNNVKDNEKILEYEKQLPKTLRSMKYYKTKHKLNWNKKNTKPIDKLQAKPNPITEKKAIDNKVSEIAETVLNRYVNTGKQTDSELNITTDEVIELTEVINPIAIGEKTEKGKNRELRKKGLLPFIKKVDKTINRIQNGYPIAMVKGFGNNWKVIEEFSSMGNCNSSNVKELTGWVSIELAQKVYNQAIINRTME